MTGYMFASVKNLICPRNAPWLQYRRLSGRNPSEQHPPVILWHPLGLGALVLQAFPVGNNNAHVRESPRSVSLLLKTSHSSPLDITSLRTVIAQGLSSSAGVSVCKENSSDRHSQTHLNLHCHLHSEALRHFTALHWCTFAVSELHQYLISTCKISICTQKLGGLVQTQTVCSCCDKHSST